ncbi:hypothetical protein LHYA1_G006165 [Lachnellula hyalina]|uniref:Uncharacterized protein n=1 Tax=Lachnellula hyalina TaxID=1316788 RepID=A0A8H8QWB1_9HELO|nr:uncharacterized protein LHYA1_G006165 [Lachnellula hyalina]TVY23868.1 hypothetical protein LHYA1_G006165 [Lachnellula hyalina]
MTLNPTRPLPQPLIPTPTNVPQAPRVIVSLHQPSCVGLPPSWNALHDRFIAYLATHAPLDRNGRAPRYEERRERWKTNDIVRLIGERFPKLNGHKIKATAIEMRLALLDQAGDNDYFKMGYKKYEREEWGKGI